MKKNIIDRILSRVEFVSSPPILVDVGASGRLVREWKKIAKYSICIAFDADERELECVKRDSAYKELFVYNSALVTDDIINKTGFYLTASPYCSSTLLPLTDRLTPWTFSDLFTVVGTVKVNSISMSEIIRDRKISRIDWFKTDSQGTDLRLFMSMGDNVIQKVIVAEFEPGIIDAYEGEDKLHALLSWIDKSVFWISDMVVKGARRCDMVVAARYFSKKDLRFVGRVLKKSPAWAEVSCLNRFSDESQFGIRELLLGCVFADIKDQFGYGLELAEKGKKMFKDPIFTEIEEHFKNKIRASIGLGLRAKMLLKDCLVFFNIKK